MVPLYPAHSADWQYDSFIIKNYYRFAEEHQTNANKGSPETAPLDGSCDVTGDSALFASC